MKRLQPTRLRRWLSRALLCPLVIVAVPVSAQAFVREKLRIPMEAAGPRGLEALLVRPASSERLPLVIITHGSTTDARRRLRFTPLFYMPQAIEFARRGWAVIIVMRRGYGDSGGAAREGLRQCDDRDYVRLGHTSAEDLRAAIAHLATRPDIDPLRILAIGVSGGGFAVTALTVDPPPGLVAAINFAGGIGWLNDREVCRRDTIVRAFHTFGTRSRVPMLWVYSVNDRLFGSLHHAFTEAGGIAEFIEAPAFGNDGHNLFSRDGIPVWTPYVDAFLGRQSLVFRQELLPLPLPLQAPAGCSVLLGQLPWRPPCAQ